MWNGCYLCRTARARGPRHVARPRVRPVPLECFGCLSGRRISCTQKQCDFSPNPGRHGLIVKSDSQLQRRIQHLLFAPILLKRTRRTVILQKSNCTTMWTAPVGPKMVSEVKLQRFNSLYDSASEHKQNDAPGGWRAATQTKKNVLENRLSNAIVGLAWCCSLRSVTERRHNKMWMCCRTVIHVDVKIRATGLNKEWNWLFWVFFVKVKSHSFNADIQVNSWTRPCVAISDSNWISHSFGIWDLRRALSGPMTKREP